MTTQPPQPDDADRERGPEGPPRPPSEHPPAPGGEAPPPAAQPQPGEQPQHGAQPQPAAQPQHGAQPPPAGVPYAGPHSPASSGAPGTGVITGGPAGYGGPVPPGGWQQPVPRASALPADVQLASWGSRVGAYLIDGLIQTLIVIVCAVPGGILLGLDPSGALGIVLLVLGIFLGFALAGLLYPALMVQRDGAHNGQTLGKQVVGIRAINIDGQPFRWGRALLREVVIKYLLFGWVASFFLSVPTLLDWLWPLWDDENRALHDMLANSRVVRA